MQPWERLESTLTADYRVLRTRVDRLRSPRSGEVSEFIILEAPDWVNVVALDETGQAIMVRQIRHGTRTTSLEVPGGMVDPGEEPLQAARRELLEETGYHTEDWRLLGFVHPNPAIMDNRCFTFLASGCRQVAEPHLDGFEDLWLELYPASELPRLVDSGEITHALVVGAVYFYLQDLAKQAGK